MFLCKSYLSGYAIIQLPELALYCYKHFKDWLKRKSVQPSTKSRVGVDQHKTIRGQNLYGTENNLDEKHQIIGIQKTTINEIMSQLEKLSQNVARLNDIVLKDGLTSDFSE